MQAIEMSEQDLGIGFQCAVCGKNLSPGAEHMLALSDNLSEARCKDHASILGLSSPREVEDNE